MGLFLEIGLSNAAAALILAMLAFAVGRVCRRPAVVHGLWLLVLIKLVTPPLFRVPVVTLPAAEIAPETHALVAAAPPGTSAFETNSPTLPASEDFGPVAGDTLPSDTADAQQEPAPSPEPESDTNYVPAPEPAAPTVSVWRAWIVEHWQALLCGSWLAGSAAWLALAMYRVIGFHRLLRLARPAPEALSERAAGVAQRLGLRRCPELRLAPGPISPMLWAMTGRPCLLLPEELLARLSDRQQSALLAHELAHYRRGDHWIRWLELAATCWYWWNPVVWLAKRAVREAEEQCCDAWVVWALPNAARSYALALVETVDYLSEARPALPVGASGLGQICQLKRRVTMIMRGNTPRSLTWVGSLGLLGLAVALVPWLPTWAQERPREAPPERRERDQPNPEKDARIAQTREQIQKLSEQMNRLGEQMRQLSEQMQGAQRQLAELEGRPAPEAAGRGGPRFGSGIRGERRPGDGDRGPGEGERGERRSAPGSDRGRDFAPMPPGAPAFPGGGQPGQPAQPGQGGGFGRGGFGGFGGGAFGGGFPGGAAPMANIEQRMAEMERKLEHVVQMIERMQQPQPRMPGEPGGRNRGARPDGDGERRDRGGSDTPRNVRPPSARDGAGEPPATPELPRVPREAPAPVAPPATPRAPGGALPPLPTPR